MGIHSFEIIVGIDFGTTHSGVSWAANGASKTIRLINTWPDPQAQNASKEKVPSSISYQNGVPKNWGYVVGLNDESFRWVKILLEENHKYATTVAPVNTLLRKVEKTAQDVVSDYLKLIWDYTIDDIKKFHPEDTFDLRVILTVPAIWSAAAKDKTLRAAKSAGIPGRIKLVTEPEAAALATLKEKADENQLKVGDAFVVCDAGGGTVDLISYKVDALNPLQIKECAIGSGGLCGSAFLDVAFIKHIETLVGATQYQDIKESNRKRMMKDFEFGIKRCFSGKNDPDFSVELIGVKDDPGSGIVDDTIVIKPAALAACFDVVSQQIQKLVSDQIADVRDRGLTVKAILLVGGFGESPYIYNRLKACHEPSNVKVMRVNGAWSSVCRGATLWGLEHPDTDTAADGPLSPPHSFVSKPAPTVTSRISRYSYGMRVSVPYNPNTHLIQDQFRDHKTGDLMAADQMEWLLRRGEEVEEGRIVTTSHTRVIEVGWRDTGEMKFSTNLWHCEQPGPPSRLTPAVRPLCSIDYHAENHKLWREKSFKGKDGEKHRKATFNVIILLGNASMDFMIGYKGELAGHAEAKYLDKFT